MHPIDLKKRIDSYQKQVLRAYDIGPINYRSTLKDILYQIVRDFREQIYTYSEAQEVWRSVLPGVGLEGYDDLSESIRKNDSYSISFDSADQLADMLSAYRRDNK